VTRSTSPDPALAATLRRLRAERGITRETLAFRSGITTGSLARIELAQASPGWDTVRLLAQGLDISMAELGAAVEGRSLPSSSFEY
jgi:transcriptional regulator with XRE-family HTH domain